MSTLQRFIMNSFLLEYFFCDFHIEFRSINLIFAGDTSIKNQDEKTTINHINLMYSVF
jgi:hypothetical protein